MPVPDAVAYVRAALPPPPARILEIGAGDGALAAALARAGYDVVAIDPRGAPALPIALEDIDAPPCSFDAAVAMLSLHHVVPLGRSLRRLSEVLRHGARLVVDEFDVARLDERATTWWLRHNPGHQHEPADVMAEMREHLHSVDHLRGQLMPWFDLGEPVPGAYLYRWHIDPALRDEEEALIAAGELPATGSRFVAVRR